MFKSNAITIFFSLLFALGCASAPETRAEEHSLESSADHALRAMRDKDPTLEPLLDTASAYVVFPSVGEGGFIAGAAVGSGVVYVDDDPVGYATLNEGSVGAQVGGQSFAQLIVIRDPADWRDLRDGDFELTADASATMVTAGAGASASSDASTTVFIDDPSGAMLEASVGGQVVEYQPNS